jgi:hypothetical protein
MDRSWFPLRVPSIFSVNLYCFDGIDGSPLAENGEITTLVRARPEMASPFDFLTSVCSSLIVKISFLFLNVHNLFGFFDLR